MTSRPTFLSRPISIFILVFSATLFASNHIAARFAFDHDTGLLLAIFVRSATALLIMVGIALVLKSSFRIPRKLRKWQIMLGILITVQSIFLYSAITRIPIALALLLVNTWPMMFILANWITKRSEPSLKVFSVLVFILVGLYFVLDVPADQVVTSDWILGVVLAWLSAVLLAYAMWISQYHMAHISGPVRSGYTMLFVVISCIAVTGFESTSELFSLPQSTTGWIALAALALLYGTASTFIFALAPKLDMTKNSPVLNAEPVASLVLAYALLGQTLSGMQMIGGAIVIVGIITISTMR